MALWCLAMGQACRSRSFAKVHRAAVTVLLPVDALRPKTKKSDHAPRPASAGRAALVHEAQPAVCGWGASESGLPLTSGVRTPLRIPCVCMRPYLSSSPMSGLRACLHHCSHEPMRAYLCAGANRSRCHLCLGFGAPASIGAGSACAWELGNHHAGVGLLARVQAWSCRPAEIPLCMNVQPGSVGTVSGLLSRGRRHCTVPPLLSSVWLARVWCVQTRALFPSSCSCPGRLMRGETRCRRANVRPGAATRPSVRRGCRSRCGQGFAFQVFAQSNVRAVVFSKYLWQGGRRGPGAWPWAGCPRTHSGRPHAGRGLGFEPRVEGLGLPPPRAQSAPQPDDHACAHAWTQCSHACCCALWMTCTELDHAICVRPLRTGSVVCTLVHM